MGLLDVYGENPHERRIRATGAMMGSSGLARPVLAYVMGRELGGAEEWDKEKGEAVSRAAKDAADRDWAQKIMGQVVELSKKDAVAATQVLKAESARNSYLAPYSGIQFNAETTAEGWATYTDGTGQGWQQYLPALNKRNEDGSPLSDEQLEQQGFRRKIGAPKPAESPKTPYTKGKRETFVGQGGFDYEGTYQGQDDKDEPVFSSIVKKAKEGDGSGKARTLPDILDDIRATSSALGQIENEGLTNKILAASSSNPKIAEALRDSRGREEAKASMNRLLSILKDDYKKLSGKEYMGEAPMQAAAPAKGGKALDEATAVQILKEAGGDRNKARLIAKQKGYIF